MPDIIEIADAANNLTTSYTLGIGQTLSGTLSPGGDRDFYAVTLEAGQTYTFALIGTGGTRVHDTYLTLRNAAGTSLWEDDDAGPGLSPMITYTATESGTYYLDAWSYAGYYSGTYGLSATLGTRANFDHEMGAGALLAPGASWSTTPGTGVNLTWAARDTNLNQTLADGTATPFIQATDWQIAAFETAISLVTDVSNLTFTRVNPDGYSDDATVLLGAYQGNDGAGAYAYYPSSQPTGGDVSLNNNSITENRIGDGLYASFAILHELGHALGLAHPGEYNAGVGVTITYGQHAQFTQDSQQYTVMSYFDEMSTGSMQSFGGYPDTLLMFDIMALQALYGANMSVRSDDSVYGFNANTGDVYDFTKNAIPFLCIWDGGGVDTLDFSGYAFDQRIDLRAGSFSNVGGFSGNVSIAVGAVIENAIGGAGTDVLMGNDVGNILDGGAGADHMTGGMGNDTYIVDHVGDVIVEVTGEGADTVRSSISFAFSGQSLENLVLTGTDHINATGNTKANKIVGNSGNNILDGKSGADHMTGGFGDDTYIVDNVKDVIVEVTGQGTDTVRASVSYAFTGQSLENLILTGSGHINATANTKANILVGNSGNNILDGKTGADHMTGGKGDDTYVIDNVGDVIVEVTGQGNDTVRSSISFAFTGQSLENLILTGSANINATANTKANILVGNSGNNILDGKTGADHMTGGFGDDTYIVDNVGDVIVEVTDQGNDTVRSSISFAFTGQSLENLILTGSDNINATANTRANILVGNSGNNILDGKSGADHMTGGKGDDTYIVDNVKDVIVEVTGQGNDTVRSSVTYAFTGQSLENLILTGSGNINATANTKANILVGNSGNNVLDGKTGADHMTGGKGNDTYVVDNIGDVIVETTGQGNDTVRSSISFAFTGQSLENLTLTGSDDINGSANSLNNIVTGNSGSNILDGKTGDDVLDGGAGADTLIGGKGDDTYVIDNVGDVIIETTGQGNDTVMSSISFAFTGQSLENLTLTGSADINGSANSRNNIVTGNSGANTLDGKTGNDVLDGGAGADILIGGMGDDTYVIDNVGDVIIETTGQGNDTVRSSISFAFSGQSLEDLILTGTANTNATANSKANIVTGNSGNNVINGMGGADTLTGGGGSDTFVFNSTAHSTVPASDRITDLSDNDFIDLSKIDANTTVGGKQTFSLVDAFTNTAGQVTLSYDVGTNITSLMADTNGDGVADMLVRLNGDHENFDNFIFGGS